MGHSQKNLELNQFKTTYQNNFRYKKDSRNLT